MKQIHVSDTTLKKLCEKRDVALLFREKTAIAACADSLGADAVELPAVNLERRKALLTEEFYGCTQSGQSVGEGLYWPFIHSRLAGQNIMPFIAVSGKHRSEGAHRGSGVAEKEIAGAQRLG